MPLPIADFVCMPRMTPEPKDQPRAEGDAKNYGSGVADACLRSSQQQEVTRGIFRVID